MAKRVSRSQNSNFTRFLKYLEHQKWYLATSNMAKRVVIREIRSRLGGIDRDITTLSAHALIGHCLGNSHVTCQNWIIKSWFRYLHWIIKSWFRYLHWIIKSWFRYLHWIIKSWFRYLHWIIKSWFRYLHWIIKSWFQYLHWIIKSWFKMLAGVWRPVYSIFGRALSTTF